MKLRNKLLISLLIFCFILILSKTTFGAIDTITIKVGESYDISASTAIPGTKDIAACSVKGEAAVSIKTNNVWGEDYVTVKGLKQGKTKIEFNVKSDGKWKLCAYNIVVEAREKVYKTLTIEVGQEQIITASEAVYGEVNIMAVANEGGEIISVDKDETFVKPDQIRIKGLKEGTATLKFNVGPDDDDYTNCVYTIIVKDKVEKNYNITMKVGETKKITASQAVSGQENIMAAGSDDSTKVKVTKTEIAGEDYLTLEALKEGTTKVRLNVGKNDKDYKNCVYTITVEPKDKVTKTITMRVGETKIITASMAVTGKENIMAVANEGGEIISANKDETFVKPDQIKITGLKEGTATLKFNVEIDGSNYINCVYTIVVTLTGKPSEPIGDRDQSTFVDVLDNIDGYSNPGDLDAATSNKIENAASIVLSAITSIGVVVAIVILAVLGVKYMLGSVEEKAEYKKDLVPYLIGACLLFGISTFVKIFMQWGQTISNL